MVSVLQFLSSLSCFFLALSGAIVEAASVLSNSWNYCAPGQFCFPSSAELAGFNRSVSGQLFLERPIGAICYPGDPIYEAMACAIQSNFTSDDQWISDQFSSYEVGYWETCGLSDSCIVPPSGDRTVCGQGSVPNYAVHARSIDHVKKYIKFATKHNLRIVVKNTGHDLKGRSAGKDGFALWIHHINSTHRNEHFVPKGCHSKPQDSFTVGGGVQWGTAYKRADELNITLVGGRANQVGGSGGWLMGGGHSLLTPVWGLGVDNLLEMDIVTPDGELQTISECSNPDLFWAVRGGGGGTWGVAVSSTYKAHPAITPSVVSLVGLDLTLGRNDMETILGKFASLAPELAELGVGGSFSIDNTSVDLFGVLPMGSLQQLQYAISPFLETLNATAGTAGKVTVRFDQFPSFYVLANVASSSSYGASFTLSSRLIPRHYFKDYSMGVAKALLDGQSLASSAGYQIPMTIVMVPPPRPTHAGKTSLNPVWYDSLWHVLFGSGWDPRTASVKDTRAVTEAVHLAAGAARAFAPDGGAYQNEADVYEPNHEQAFWGSNYDRLLKIKRRIDPKNIMQVWQGVGWDGPKSTRFRCYKENRPTGSDLGF